MAESEPVSSACVVCCHDTWIWALGECNHRTCLLCCVRLRVLCDQNDCPVCRHTLKQVAVVSVVRPYQTLRVQHWAFSNRKFDLYFPTKELFMAFREIIDNRCNLCPYLPPLKNFNRLQEHVSRTHQLHFCDICVENLKLFPSEFKVYTRQKLIVHRRTGDVEDSSYKGHPYCQFCDERYLDKDALHMHLRKQHFWCHFCESDGRQDFYADIYFLRLHFKKEHYLCEEGDCYHEVLSAAFRNELDLKAHVANSHSKGLSRAEVKKMRHLPVEFHVNAVAEDSVPVNRRRAVPIREPGGSGHMKEAREKEERELAVAMSASLHEAREKENKPTKRLHGRKKVLCAQKDPEPPPVPPGFGVLKTHNDSEMKVGVEPGSVATADHTEASIRTEAVTVGDTRLGNGNETWPSLGAAECNQSDAGSTVKDTTGEHTEPADTSPPPITPPPGYAKIIRPTKTLQLVNTKLPKQPGKSETSAFPPLVSAAGPPGLSATADAPGPSASSSKSSGGSKVFEDIRKALDYDKEKFKHFQTLSGWFRSERIPLKNYSKQCEDLFGPQWAKIGPLVAKAMPKGGKREELLSLFGQSSGSTSSTVKQSSRKNNKAKKVPSAWATGGSEELREGAATVVASRIMNEEDYPSLNTASKQQPPKTSAYYKVWNVPVHT